MTNNNNTFESVFNHSTTTTAGAFGNIKDIINIAQDLDNHASSEDVITLKKLRAEGIIITDEPTCTFYIVFIIARTMSFGDFTSPSSLDGYIGGILSSEFSYRILSRPKLVAAYDDGVSKKLHYNFAFNWIIPKKLQKILRSSEQYTDSPNLHKRVCVISMKTDLAAGAHFYECSGKYEEEYTERTMKLSEWAGPAI